MGIETALVVTAVAGAAQAGVSIAAGEKGRKEARRAGRAQAAALRAEAAAERERGRRLAASQRAAFGAAGVAQEGTPLLVGAQSYLDSVRARERILAGARTVRREAEARGDALRLEGISGAVRGVSQAVSAATDPRFPI